MKAHFTIYQETLKWEHGWVWYGEKSFGPFKTPDLAMQYMEKHGLKGDFARQPFRGQTRFIIAKEGGD